MTQILSALAPVFVLILLGYLLKSRRLVSAAFWPPAEKLTYYLFFPALLVFNTSQANLEGLRIGPMAAVLIGGVGSIALLVLALRPRMDLDGAAFTSVFQGSFRPNTYVAIAAAFALFDQAGLTLIAVCIVVLVPTVNLFSVIAMVRYATPGGGAPGWPGTLAAVATNPLILACLLGALINVSGYGLPPVAGPLLDILGRAALPIGLIAVGAGLDIPAARAAGRIVAATAVIKLAALPLATIALCRLAGIEGLTATVLVMYAAVPGSPSSYVLARQMGGDAELMAGIITATTLAAMAAMPLWVMAAG